MGSKEGIDQLSMINFEKSLSLGSGQSQKHRVGPGVGRWTIFFFKNHLVVRNSTGCFMPKRTTPLECVMQTI